MVRSLAVVLLLLAGCVSPAPAPERIGFHMEGTDCAESGVGVAVPAERIQSYVPPGHSALLDEGGLATVWLVAATCREGVTDDLADGVFRWAGVGVWLAPYDANTIRMATIATVLDGRGFTDLSWAGWPAVQAQGFHVAIDQDASGVPIWDRAKAIVDSELGRMHFEVEGTLEGINPARAEWFSSTGHARLTFDFFSSDYRYGPAQIDIERDSEIAVVIGRTPALGIGAVMAYETMVVNLEPTS